MTYSNTLATIASIGVPSTPIPTTVSSVSAPTSRKNGAPLQQGDIWWEPTTLTEYLYLTDVGDTGRWQQVAGRGFILEVTNGAGGSGSGYTLPPATGTTLGGVIVGAGLDVDTMGVLTVNSVEDFQTLTVHGTSTLHTIVTGADASGVAINASAGEITAKWMNVGYYDPADTSDPNWGVSLRTTGRVISGELTATAINCSGTTISALTNVTTLAGARQGLVYKLNAGDGMTFEGSLHGHIGGTVGNDYHSNSGTLGVDNSVLRNTGTQTINGDINMTSAGAAGGTIQMNTIKFKLNYGDSSQIGPGTNTGQMAFINGAPAYANGTDWVSLAPNQNIGVSSTQTQVFSTAAQAGTPTLGKLVTIANKLYFGTGLAWKEVPLSSLELE